MLEYLRFKNISSRYLYPLQDFLFLYFVENILYLLL